MKSFYDNAVNNYELLIELYNKENPEMAEVMSKLHEGSKKTRGGKFDTLVTAELKKRGFQIDNIDELKTVTQALTHLPDVLNYAAENMEHSYPDATEAAKLSLYGILNYLDIPITPQLKNEVEESAELIGGLV